MIRTASFTSERNDIDDKINDFLSNEGDSIEVIDIKYSICCDDTYTTEGALVIYKIIEE